jgi:hypothetical protein
MFGNIVCHDKMYIFTKIGVIIAKCDMDFVMSKVIWLRNQVKSYVVAFFVKFFSQISILKVWYFS